MKTIIIYTTKYGCTRSVAKRLQAMLGGETQLADANGTVPSLEPYDAVILGGSVYIGHVQKALTTFIDRHLPELLDKKTGLFLCAGVTDPEVQKQELQNAFAPELLEHAVAKDILGYGFDFQKMNWIERLMVGAMRGNRKNESVFFEQNILQFIHKLQTAPHPMPAGKTRI
ncbi:flavodoxin domain-containing protein [Ethanoligenens harbinense]|uniref:Flavodoxin n=1 Tax=Ethanoligenens harbinense (strain DSM 18485 / JCM 12961 / CGMCC 1.5033 / YUAN-3) TaxID=663278 RepID=E6U672_ETHHY|nr:flavodoxin domain-containing protein [Ethanoligenens harbinense]ADU26839.1 flavodoxin [Ethanoligenens harbinense YUAN-3]